MSDLFRACCCNGHVSAASSPSSARAPLTRTQLACATHVLTVFVTGVGSLLFAFAVTNTLFNAILMQHLLPHQQAKFQTPVQTLAAVGRGMGPFLGTLIIAKGDEYERGLGPTLMLAMSFTAISLSILVPAAFGGSFFDPPKPAAMW